MSVTGPSVMLWVFQSRLSHHWTLTPTLVTVATTVASGSGRVVRFSWSSSGWIATRLPTCIPRRDKVAAIGRQFAGDLNIYGTNGWDLAGFAECHCDGYGDVSSFSERVNPEGRSWFTYWLAVHAGPNLAGVDIQTGDILRLWTDLFEHGTRSNTCT